MSRFFLTTAIDYVNSRPHLGTAYEKIMADVIARYKRLCGVDTRFLMGNDEHSQNVFRKASEEGLDPLAYCDRMEEQFRDTWRRLDISFDDFIRTTEPRHKAGVTDIVKRIYAAGDIYEGVYEGWYCVSCEEFKQEKDLIDGKCPLHLTQPQWIREKNYFFRLSKYQQPLLEHFAAHADFLQPEIRRNEILRLIESGLIDISVSRAGQAWGIPLPFDSSSVVYVWFDALVNYASAVGLGGDPDLFARWWPADLHIIGKDITRFHTVIWPAMLMSAGLPVPRQVFGHGFMTVNGQRMSKSLGTAIDPTEAADRFGADSLRLYLVKEIAFGGDGDFSWERYDERYNVDLANNLGNLVSRVTAMAGRYRHGRVTPTGAGSDQLARIGEQLAVDYRRSMDALALHEGAAAAFRIVDAANEFIAATAPWALAKDPAAVGRLSQVLFDAAEAIRLAAVLLAPIMPTASREILRRVGVASDPLHLDRDGRWRAEGERLLLQEGPLWPRHETPERESLRSSARSEERLGGGAPSRDVKRDRESLRSSTASEVRARVGEAPGDPRGRESTLESEGAKSGLEWGPAASAEAESLRSRPKVRKRAEAEPHNETPERESLRSSARSGERLGGGAPSRDVKNHKEPSVTDNPTPTPPPVQPAASASGADDRISIDEFMKIDLRVAKVLAAERVPNSKKLIKLQVDAGSEQRTVVAGIADAYEPDALIGRSVVIVSNLKPAKLMGVESNGMVLAASPDGGKPALLTFDDPPPSGTRVR